MGHPVLRRVAEPVDPEQIQADAFQRFIVDLRETMAAYQGVGLAAPQVHVSNRVLVYLAMGEEDRDPEVLVLVNPVIEPMGDEMESSWEGCLSIPDIRGLVSRHSQIKVTALDDTGQDVSYVARDFEARVIQHEVDHLDGILYLDRMDDLATLSFQAEYDTFWARDEDEDDSE
jgi:peptide deformylase